MVVPSCNATAVERARVVWVYFGRFGEDGLTTWRAEPKRHESVEQITHPRHTSERDRRRRGAPRGNRNARKHGIYGAAAIEIRALMRLQLRVAELANAYVGLAPAVVGLIDGERGADARLGRAREAIESRSAALVRAALAMQRFLVEHDRVVEARDLAAEVSAVIAPAPRLAAFPAAAASDG